MLKIKILLGLIALASAWAVLFQRGLVFKINAWVRENIFNDRVVLFSGKRVAVLLLILGGVCIFSAIEDATYIEPIRPHIASKMREDANQDFREGRYQRVVKLCQELVRGDPRDVEAWQMLAYASWALGNRDQARQAAESVLRIDPDNPIGQSDIISRPKTRKKKKAK